MRLKKTLAAASVIAISALGLTACQDAEVASYNLSKDSDNFKVERRVVFFNGITDKYLLELEGKCSINPDTAEDQLEVVCKTGDDEYKKHFLGLSDNVSYLVEQTEPHEADPYHYKLTFKPEVIIPDIDLRTSGGDK